MSKDMKSNNNQDSFFIFTVVCFLLFMIYYKYRVYILKAYLEYRVQIAFCITVLILAVYLKIKTVLREKFKYTNLENEVLGESLGESSVFAGFSDKGKRVYIKPSLS